MSVYDDDSEATDHLSTARQYAVSAEFGHPVDNDEARRWRTCARTHALVSIAESLAKLTSNDKPKSDKQSRETGCFRLSYFRHPYYPGGDLHNCGYVWDEHGYLDLGDTGYTICPSGDGPFGGQFATELGRAVSGVVNKIGGRE